MAGWKGAIWDMSPWLGGPGIFTRSGKFPSAAGFLLGSPWLFGIGWRETHRKEGSKEENAAVEDRNIKVVARRLNAGELDVNLLWRWVVSWGNLYQSSHCWRTNSYLGESPVPSNLLGALGLVALVFPLSSFWRINDFWKWKMWRITADYCVDEVEIIKILPLPHQYLGTSKPLHTKSLVSYSAEVFFVVKQCLIVSLL